MGFTGSKCRIRQPKVSKMWGDEGVEQAMYPTMIGNILADEQYPENETRMDSVFELGGGYGYRWTRM